jgi:ribosome-associated protein
MDDELEIKSRSQVKREVEAKQQLGLRLADIADARLEKLGLPPELLEALRLYRRLTKRGALRRQRQYIGVLMRTLETAPIERALAELDHNRELEKRRFHRAVQCRDRLLEGDDACLEELIDGFPDVDIQHLRALVRNAGREAEAGKPPRSTRLIFRYLTDLFSAANDPAADPPSAEEEPE